MDNHFTINLNEDQCQGCGYCVSFCPQKCFVIKKDKFNSRGFLVPEISNPENCIGCGICVRMCPAMVIEVCKEDIELKK
jgi:2-oxoglutarate ferredoxin oxidoreductase subunit delta